MKTILCWCAATVLPLLWPLCGLSDSDDSSEIAVLSPNRIDYVQFSYDRNWAFLDDSRDADFLAAGGCGVRFIEGEVDGVDNVSDAKFLEPLGEFCEDASPIRLYGAYLIKYETVGSTQWIVGASDVYLWRDNDLVVVLEPWMNNMKQPGEPVPCRDIGLGPHGETNEDDRRTCVMYRYDLLFEKPEQTAP